MKHVVFIAGFAAYLAFPVLLINARLGDIVGTVARLVR